MSASDAKSDKRHWVAWHGAYDDPNSGLSWRLGVIQERIRSALEGLPAGPIRAVSLCAGQGRDLIGALAGHPRGQDVRARLVELDPHNAVVAAQLAAEAGLTGVDVVTADASETSAYAGAVPAELILACGVFGNITNDDVRTTIGLLPSLAAPGTTVIWTRHRRPPDLTVAIRSWFAEAGFEEVAFDAHPSRVQTVGTHRLVRPPDPFRPGVRMFEFVGYDALTGDTGGTRGTPGRPGGG